jgi:hypothetical protein
MEPYYHIAFAVPDLEDAQTQMGALFGVSWCPRTIEHQVRLGDGRVIDRTSVSVWSDGFPAIQLMLSSGLTGVQLDHVGRFVDDLPMEARELEAAGFPLIMTSATPDGVPAGFTMHQTRHHFAVELVENRLRGAHATPLDRG